MDHFGAISVFLSVVEGKSFSVGAERLGISKSAASKRITLLEQQLGVKLLHRTTRKLSLTEAGTRYLEHAHKAQNAARDARDAVAELQGEPQGMLRINAPMSFGRLHIAPLVPRFLKKFPKINMDLVMNDKAVNLIEDGYDISIHAGGLQNSSLISRKLMPLHSVICASPQYVEQFGSPLTPTELSQHNCISYSYSDQAAEWTFLKGKSEPLKVTVHGNYQVNNSEALCEALLHGLGIARLPTFVAGHYIKQKRLVPLLSAYRLPPAYLYALFPDRNFLPAKVRAFIDFSVHAFGTEKPYWDDRT